MLSVLEDGDVLIVTRLGRLARSTPDLLNTLSAITERKASFRSLGYTWADTTTAHGRLMLTVLRGLGEFERELIRAITGQGRARAVARGVKMGRPPTLPPYQQKEAIRRRDNDAPMCDIARTFNVSHSTIRDWVHLDATQTVHANLQTRNGLLYRPRRNQQQARTGVLGWSVYCYVERR